MGLGLGLGLGLRLRLRLRLLLLLLLEALCGAASGLHSLRYFHLAVSEPNLGLPEFTIVGYVDGNPFVCYDSKTGKVEPQADWVRGAVDPQYLEKSIQEVKHIDHMCLHILRGRYNQSKGAHTLQRMIGCDLLEDNSTRGYVQYGYDGRDFTFDMDTMTFTVADPAAQITKWKWENGTVAEWWKLYLKGTCIDLLRKYVNYGRAVLERKEPESNLLTIVVAVAAAVLAVIAIIAGVALWKYKSGKKNKGYGVALCTDGGSDSSTTGVSILMP